MPNKNSKMDIEIDGGKFFLWLFNIFLIIGGLSFFIWFYTSVYKPEEKKYIKLTRYAYSLIQKEMTAMFSEKGFVFDPNNEKDDTFCNNLILKYAKNKSGTCVNFNPISPIQNFVFEKSEIAVYGLEKPLSQINNAFVKDIIIDINGEDKGDNQVGTDRTIIRIYSSGRVAGIMAPVNCSKSDETEYDLKRSLYCIGAPEINFLLLNKPLGFDIEQIGGNEGKTRAINKNVSFIRADCSAFGGDISGADEYCSEKMLYQLKGCDDEFLCNIALTNY